MKKLTLLSICIISSLISCTEESTSENVFEGTTEGALTQTIYFQGETYKVKVSENEDGDLEPIR